MPVTGELTFPDVPGKINEHNQSPNAHSVRIDNTVSQSGMAADAKATRDLVDAIDDEVTDLKSAIGNKSSLNTDTKANLVSAINEVNGHFLGGIEEGVANWLNDHPEATTTVQDGSLTDIKLSPGTIGVITPEMYGAVGDGDTDDTTAIQSAIDASHGFVSFKNKTYKVSSLELKNHTIYDFNGAAINFTGQNAIHGTGEKILETTTSSAYSANNDSFTLTSVSGISVGDIITVVNTSELAHTARNYYYKGATFEIKKISDNNVYINGSLPYSINSGASVNVYTPFTCQIYNISDVSYVGNNLTEATYAISIEHGNGCIICNYSSKNELGGHIVPFRSVNTIIENVNCNIPHESSLLNPYVIEVLSSTNTTIKNANITSFWHAITTGYQESVLNTIIQDSNLFNSGIIAALEDHDNAIGTKVIDCMCDGILISQSGCIIRCVTKNRETERIPPICLHGSTSYSNSHFVVKDCKLIGNSSTTDQYNGIMLMSGALGNVVVENCTCVDFCNIFNSSDSSVNNVTISNCENLFPALSYGSNANLVYFHNCVFKNHDTWRCSRVTDVIIDKCLFLLDENATASYTFETIDGKNTKITNTRFKSDSQTKYITASLNGKVLLDNVDTEGYISNWTIKSNADLALNNTSFPTSSFSTASAIRGMYVAPITNVVSHFQTINGTKYRGSLSGVSFTVEYSTL